MCDSVGIRSRCPPLSASLGKPIFAWARSSLLACSPLTLSTPLGFYLTQSSLLPLHICTEGQNRGLLKPSNLTCHKQCQPNVELRQSRNEMTKALSLEMRTETVWTDDYTVPLFLHTCSLVQGGKASARYHSVPAGNHTQS